MTSVSRAATSVLSTTNSPALPRVMSTAMACRKEAHSGRYDD